MKSRPLIVATALAGAVAITTGCGSQSSGSGSTRPASAQQELNDGFKALANASTLTTTIKIGLTPQQLMSLPGSGKPLTAVQAQKISAGEIVVESQAPSGKTIGQSAQAGSATGSTSFAVLDAGKPYLQVVGTKQVLYLRADVQGALTLFNEQNQFATLAARAKSLPPFAQALIAGKWVSLPYDTAKSLFGLFGGASGLQPPNSTQSKQIVAGLQKILATDVTTTRVSEGSTDHLVLTADSRKLVVDFLHTIASAVPAIGSKLAGATPQSIPSKQIHLDAYVAKNVATGLSFDVGQFAPKRKQPFSFPINVTFARSGPAITAPSGATPVDEAQLGSLLRTIGGSQAS